MFQGSKSKVLKTVSLALSAVMLISAAISSAQELPVPVDQPGQIEQSSEAGIVGTWQGALAVQGFELRLVLHVRLGEDGKLAATLDSIESLLASSVQSPALPSVASLVPTPVKNPLDVSCNPGSAGFPATLCVSRIRPFLNSTTRWTNPVRRVQDSSIS